MQKIKNDCFVDDDTYNDTSKTWLLKIVDVGNVGKQHV